VTMHPDNHAPHPCRAFDDPELTLPPRPLHKRTAVLIAQQRDAEAPRPWLLWFVVSLIEVVVASFALAAVMVALLIAFGSDAQINAWGLWFRAIVGG